MSIRYVRINNLTVFDDLTVNLSNGVNVFIGQNGTGKTHLLKAVYGACDVQRDASSRLSYIFKNDYGNMNLFHSKNDKGIQQLDIYLDITDECKANMKTMGNIYIGSSELPTDTDDEKRYKIHLPKDKAYHAVYIPVKDMLTHSKGLLSMSEKYREFPFDKTLTDIIRKANQWTVKNTPDMAKAVLPILEKIMDGEVYIENEEFFIKKKNGDLINFAVEAEGIKKIGLLWQLIMTENIAENSILLWDEPEANLNPEYLPYLVECLLELSRHNVQIMVSTHNYIFAKYFDVKRGEKDLVKFHALYKEHNVALCETKDFFGDLEHNAITETFNKLLDEVYGFEGE